ncbi:formate dehydrogenase accessory sulfurtransferase FdhD [Roseburia hominis]
MYINEQYENLELTENEDTTCIFRDKHAEASKETVLAEHLLEVYLNERLTMKLVCTPEHLTELVLGRLFSEGMINDTDEVESIYICKYGTRAKVMLRNTSPALQVQQVETTPTCCTGNRVLYEPVSDNPLHVMDFASWQAEWIFMLADKFSEGTPLHRKTWATHSCFLARRDRLLFQCEDIGRHNALDKVIGYALRHRIPLSECFVYSSGRIPVDMVSKAIRARLPLLVSKAVPTNEAVRLAKQYHLTLICSARRDLMKVYSGQLPS